MTSEEKIQKAISLEPYASKSEIPIFPMIITYAGVPAGITQAKLFESNEIWLDSMEKTFQKIGCYPDMVMPVGAADTVFIESMKARLPGRELGDNELFQFIELPVMTEDDYQFLMDNGYQAWKMKHLCAIQEPPVTPDEAGIGQIVGRLMEVGKHFGMNRQYWESKNIPLCFHNGCAPAFDEFSMSRGMEDFFYDLYDEPEMVKNACAAATPAIIGQALQGMKPGDRIAMFAMRSSSSFISPEMFEEFAFPYMKQMVEAFYAKGIVSVIHCDGNWLPMLPYFCELPKGSCIIELDGTTDIEKSAEILRGHQCIRGDIPAATLAFGTVEETKAYCDKLINLAMDGGFIIGTGCEVPLNAKLENVQAFMNCLKC